MKRPKKITISFIDRTTNLRMYYHTFNFDPLKAANGFYSKYVKRVIQSDQLKELRKTYNRFGMAGTLFLKPKVKIQFHA